MMRKFKIILLIMLFVQHSLAQRYPFQWVNIPDSVSDILNKKYQSIDVGAGKNVYNMIVHDDFEFENGIYSYKGMGPHFPLEIFILNDSLYFFQTSSDKMREYMTEWLSYRKNINIEDNRKIIYTLAIIDYLMYENSIEPAVFSDSILSYINMSPNEYNYIKTKICSKHDSPVVNFFPPSSGNYPSMEINIEHLYGKWYFQKIIYKKRTKAGDELSQQTCEEIPLIYFNRNGRGVFYENGKRKSFNWLCKGTKLKINNVSEVFFKKRNPTLLIKNMFKHNNKIFIELENERGTIYVLSQKNKDMLQAY